jgi:hypothetical protein
MKHTTSNASEFVRRSLSRTWCLAAAAVALCCANPPCTAATIGFDDLAPPIGSGGIPIPNLYAGLQWNNFNVLNTTDPVYNPSGYLNGLISPRNVAYNAGGSPALFSSGGTFDLNSAYLTGAWNDGLNVEVQGFIGATLAYDHTYVIDSTAPTLIHFNYLGVTSVTFISSGGIPHPGYHGAGTHFAMDDLTLNVVPEPSAALLLLLGGAPMVLRWRGRR